VRGLDERPSSFYFDSAVDPLPGFCVVGPIQQSRHRNQGRSVAIAGVIIVGMPGSSARHEKAAARHAKTAVVHDRSVAFWEERGDAARADLHRDAAALERAGAALERRWAQVIASEDSGGAPSEGERRLEGDAAL
jgi:hypothetical protein